MVEEFDGGYVWELGLLFAPPYREKAWVLKRRYPDEEAERDRYDDGMGASHVELLLTGPAHTSGTTSTSYERSSTRFRENQSFALVGREIATKPAGENRDKHPPTERSDRTR